MRRPRGPGGRFLTAEERAALEAQNGGSGTSPSTSTSEHHDADDEPHSAATTGSFAVPSVPSSSRRRSAS